MDGNFERVKSTADGERGISSENKNGRINGGVAEEQSIGGSEIGVEDKLCSRNRGGNG